VKSFSSILANRRLRAAVRGMVAVPMLPLLGVAAMVARLDTARRRRRGARPRLVWGPTPIINIKYWSAALRARGYQTRTCVSQHYAMNERADFDTYFDEFMPTSIVFDPLRAYAVFLWVLRTADVYLCYFDGGFLQGTALKHLELPLLRLAGKRVVVSPYGSDIAVRGYMGALEQRVFEDYPELARNAERIRARVLEFSRWANLVIRNYQPGFIPRWDVLWPTEIGIDIEIWRPAATASSHADGNDGEVVVLHAPNHRRLKGTDRLIEAIDELRGEGLRVRLDLLERRPSTEVLAAVLRSDIVADQFIAGYALFAVEGMAAAKPVLSALGWMPAYLRENLDARGLPIVDTDRDGLLESLRTLVSDPERRQTLGEAGRRFVLEHHSYEAVGATFDAIIRHVWSGAPLPDDLLPAPRTDSGDRRNARADKHQLNASSHAP
jgi:glycosyltransferase involved in cell wall biosynthesis